jgi:ABC-type lipoprotein export system ATPase subunit
MLLVTHDARVASVADRVIYLKDGQIRTEARLETAHDSHAVLSQMFALEA